MIIPQENELVQMCQNITEEAIPNVTLGIQLGIARDIVYKKVSCMTV